MNAPIVEGLKNINPQNIDTLRLYLSSKAQMATQLLTQGADPDVPTFLDALTMVGAGCLILSGGITAFLIVNKIRQKNKFDYINTFPAGYLEEQDRLSGAEISPTADARNIPGEVAESTEKKMSPKIRKLLIERNRKINLQLEKMEAAGSNITHKEIYARLLEERIENLYKIQRG